MQTLSPILFIEINNSEFIFLAGKENDNDNFEILYKCNVPLTGISNYSITDFNLVFNTIKKNIYIAEHKLNFRFKETVLTINNFHCSFINLTGFKKLNGSQILKENITYILNSLKSNIVEHEDKKRILHIFNSKFYLDKQKVENLPIGLFGNFYSHELVFCLINEIDYKNLSNIFNKCNLKIKKILLKSFVEGSYISSSHSDVDTFFQIKINENNSQLFYFENDSLKFEQNFDFGTNIILRDISKITSLKIDVVKKIIKSNKLSDKTTDDQFVEEELFENENFRKIKKKLIFEIAKARIQEMSNILIFKNINLVNFVKKKQILFLKISDKNNLKCFEENYELIFSKKDLLNVRWLDDIKIESLLDCLNKLIHFGWKKEAIPVIQEKKSIIARFFDTLFT